jgi:general stress protein 26
MTEQADLDRVWDILEKHSIGMLTTKYGGELRARPLDARPDRRETKIFFLTDVRGRKDDEISAKPDVCFTVTVPEDNSTSRSPPAPSSRATTPRRSKSGRNPTRCGGKVARRT